MFDDVASTIDQSLPAPAALITSKHNKYGAFSRELRSTASSAGIRNTRDTLL